MIFPTAYPFKGFDEYSKWRMANKLCYENRDGHVSIVRDWDWSTPWPTFYYDLRWEASNYYENYMNLLLNSQDSLEKGDDGPKPQSIEKFARNRCNSSPISLPPGLESDNAKDQPEEKIHKNQVLHTKRRDAASKQKRRPWRYVKNVPSAMSYECISFTLNKMRRKRWHARCAGLPYWKMWLHHATRQARQLSIIQYHKTRGRIEIEKKKHGKRWGVNKKWNRNVCTVTWQR